MVLKRNASWVAQEIERKVNEAKARLLQQDEEQLRHLWICWVVAILVGIAFGFVVGSSLVTSNLADQLRKP